MSLQNEPAPLQAEHPVSPVRQKATFLKGLGLGLLAAVFCAVPFISCKDNLGILVAAIAFVGTVAYWIDGNRILYRRHGVPVETRAERIRRRYNRALLAFAALLEGPLGGVLLGLMIVLFGDVNPLDRATTIYPLGFLGMVAGAIVASGILVSSFLE